MKKGQLKSLTKTIKVAPNATAHTYIRQPYLNLNGRPLKASVWIDGQKQTKPLRLPVFSIIGSYSYTTEKPAVAFNNKEAGSGDRRRPKDAFAPAPVC